MHNELLWIFLEELVKELYEKNQIDEVLDILLEIRDNERDKKNYEVSDLIRDKLSKLGININDKQ